MSPTVFGNNSKSIESRKRNTKRCYFAVPGVGWLFELCTGIMNSIWVIDLILVIKKVTIKQISTYVLIFRPQAFFKIDNELTMIIERMHHNRRCLLLNFFRPNIVLSFSWQTFKPTSQKRELRYRPRWMRPKVSHLTHITRLSMLNRITHHTSILWLSVHTFADENEKRHRYLHVVTHSTRTITSRCVPNKYIPT